MTPTAHATIRPGNNRALPAAHKPLHSGLFLRWAAYSSIALALAACGGGSSAPAPAPGPAPAPSPAPSPSPAPAPSPSPAPSPAPVAGAAPLGDPSTEVFSGLRIVADSAAHRVSRHSVDAVPATPHAAHQAQGLPSIAPLKVLARRDAVIFYLPAVQGAADYRAYALGPSVRLNGTQPRNAVVACAGYREQNQLLRVNGQGARALLQTIELPGLARNAETTVVIEAIAAPCPFTGVPGHTSVALGKHDMPAGFPIRGFADTLATYGNEILNGQGFATDWMAGYTNRWGLPADPASSATPADPRVIARSTVRITLPAADEAVNAPIIDVGPNATFDDFTAPRQDAALAPNPELSFNERSHVAVQGGMGDWFFWGMAAQGTTDGAEVGKAVQVWQRHGRLNTTFGDWAQDVFGSLYFSSLRAPVQQMDNERYIHSFFRLESGATHRRYWHWMMCGAATRDQLIDPATGVPRLRPVGSAFFYENAATAGDNPSARRLNEKAKPWHNQECLSIIQLGENELRAMIHPAGVARGRINLTPMGANGGYGSGITVSLGANGTPNGPVLAPFTQQNPLAHFDVFVRRNRLALFVNGRLASCIDLSARPLQMNQAHIAYGHVLYHSGAEVGELGVPNNGQVHTLMGFNAADNRSWDSVGHSDNMAGIPDIFPLPESACRPPASVQVD